MCVWPPDAELTSLAQLARVRRYGKGRTLVVQGAVSETTFGIVSGRLRVSLGRANGSEATLAILGPGELVGELGLFQDGSRAAHVTALEDACVLSLEKSVVLRASAFAGCQLGALSAARVARAAARSAFRGSDGHAGGAALGAQAGFSRGALGRARCGWRRHQSQTLTTGAG